MPDNPESKSLAQLMHEVIQDIVKAFREFSKIHSDAV